MQVVVKDGLADSNQFPRHNSKKPTTSKPFISPSFRKPKNNFKSFQRQSFGTTKSIPPPPTLPPPTRRPPPPPPPPPPTRRPAQTTPKPAFMQLVIQDPYAEFRTYPGQESTTRRPVNLAKAAKGQDFIFNDIELAPKKAERNFRRTNSKKRKNNRQTSLFNQRPAAFEPLERFVTAPEIDAPFSDYSRPGSRRRNRKKNLSKKKQLKKKKFPKGHPLSQILPKNARVVGIRPLALSNRNNNPHIMTLNDFLTQFSGDMGNIKAIPVPVKGRQVNMIEKLKSPGTLEPTERDQILSELDALIADRKFRDTKSHVREKKVLKVPGDSNASKMPPVRPRGGGPGPRFFANGLDTVATAPGGKSDDFLPSRLEFGFQPLPTTTTAAPTTTTTTTRSPSTVLEFETKKEAFFFTTTEASTLETADEKLPDRSARKTSLFDMRNLFYIPPLKKRNSNENKFRTFFSP